MKSFKYIALLFVGLSFYSCTEDFFSTVVEVELPEVENTLVLNSIVRSEKPFQFQLFQAKEILTDEAVQQQLPNGSIEIYEGGVLQETVIADVVTRVDTVLQWPNFDTVIYTSSRVSYDSDMIAETGKTYEIKALAPGFDPVTSSTTMPSAPIIKAVYINDTVEVVDFYGYKDTKIELAVELEDDGSTDDFYYINILRLETQTNPYTGEEFNYRNSVCYETYDPSFESVESDPVDIEGGQWYCGLADFNDNLFNGKTKKIILLLDMYNFIDWGTGEPSEDRQIEVSIAHTAKDFYLYTRSATAQSWNDGNPFAEPVTVHSNIEDGFGIFAGISEAAKILE